MGQDELIKRAFGESFWLGVTSVLVVGIFSFLVFLVKYYQKKIEERDAKMDALRDKQEAQNRDDLKLFLEVQNALKDFRGRQVEVLLSEIRSKVDQLLTLREKV